MADVDDVSGNEGGRRADVDAAGWETGRSPSPRRRAEHTPPFPEVSEQPRSPYRRPDERRGRPDRSGGDSNPGNNLHVSGLTNKCTDRDLEEAFGKYGTIEKAQVMYDPHSREPRGFGFVTFDKVEDAEAAITAMDGADFQGRRLIVEKARRGRARTPTPGRYFGPPKAGRMDGPPGPYGGERGGPGGYGGGPPRGGGRGGFDDRYGGPPMRGYPPPYPPRDPYDRYGPPPGGRPYSPPPMRADPYDRYGRGGPPPMRDYPPRGAERDYPPPPPRGGGPPMDYPPRDYPPRGPPPGDYPPARGGYRDHSPPPRGAGRYDDLPPPPSRSAGPPGPGGPRYSDPLGPPRPRYDDPSGPPPPRRY